jgi:hypothetical protein
VVSFTWWTAGLLLSTIRFHNVVDRLRAAHTRRLRGPRMALDNRQQPPTAEHDHRSGSVVAGVSPLARLRRGAERPRRSRYPVRSLPEVYVAHGPVASRHETSAMRSTVAQ